MKISQKILLYMLPLVILPLLLLSGFSYISFKNNTEQRAISQINTALMQNLQQVQSYYKTIESTQILLSKSKLIEQYISNENSPVPAKQRQQLMDSFSQYASSYPDFYEIRLITLEGHEDVRFTTDKSQNVTKDESQTDYFLQIKNRHHVQGLFLITNPDNDEISLLSVQKIYNALLDDQSVAKLWGYLVFTIRPSAIIQVVNRSFGSTGLSIVTNSRGTIVFSAQSYLQGTVLSPALFTQLKATVDTQDLAGVQYDGLPMYFQAGQLDNDYLLFTGIAQDEIIADHEYLGLVSIVITLVVMIMVPFLLYYFLKTLVLQPIGELTMAKQAVGRGNLDVRLDVQQSDEIGELYSSFNVMVRQLKVSRERESENKSHLEDKIMGRTKALKDANRELENANKALEEARSNTEQANELKSSFLANMSHKIRTPLTAIIGFTEQALKAKNSEEEQQDYLSRVLRSGQHLLHLVNEILDLSKIEADKLVLEHKPIHLFELMTDIESLNVELAQEKSLNFVLKYNYPLPQIFNGDLFRLRQVLLNLCTNAIKFTGRGDVSLTVSFLAKTAELRFSIQDSGIGMSDQETSKLFQPFVQADPRITRKFGGSGLGLVISQKLVQLMLGSLQVESIKGLGSRFDVTIPAGIATLNMVDSLPHNKSVLSSQSINDKALPKLDDQINDFSDAHVLVAEDNSDNQYLVGLLLERFGVSYDVVDDGVKAVESAIGEFYDLILMDIQMPNLGGCEAVELLRQSCIDCPIIALTANIMKEDIDYYLKCGFDGTLAKPIQQQSFYETINKHLNASSEKNRATDKLLADLQINALVQQLKDSFKAELPEVIVNFRQYLQTNNWEKLKGDAHMIRGSAGSLGYPQLTEQAGSIEDHVKSAQFDLASDAAKTFIESCEACL
jgi:signal transduction histidine kinase/DNA-binding NarL/FixJ family response regulator